MLSCSLLAGIVPAGGVETWLSPIVVSDPGRPGSYPRVAADREGNATAVWVVEEASGNSIQASVRPAGGSWSAPVTLSRTPVSSAPELAVDGTGNATVLWVAFGGADARVQTVTRAATGAWSAPADLSTPAPTYSPSVVVDPGGRVTAAWARITPTGDLAVESATRSATGPWDAPTIVSTAPSSYNPRLAVDAAGAVTMVWGRLTSGGSQVQAASRSRLGQWSEPVDLTDADGQHGNPQVVVDDGGTATAVWYSEEHGLQARTASAPGGWSPPVILATSSTPAPIYPALAADAEGYVRVVWWQQNAIRAAVRTLDGAWSSPVDLGEEVESAGAPVLAASRGGDFVAVWPRFSGPHGVVVASRSDGPSAWSEPITISPADVDARRPQVAVDEAGNASAVWEVVDGGVQAAGLDGAGPVVGGFSAPTDGVVGQPVAFSAIASDVWAPPVSYMWSFGDGGTGHGAVVSHTYAAPGLYPIQLTVTDGVGSSTTRTTFTRVSAAPVGETVPPPPEASPGAPQVPVPRITRFSLTEPRIRGLGRAVPARTELEVRLTAAATLRVVFKSQHRHPFQGRMRHRRAVLRMSLPAGRSSITIRAKVAGVRLTPDTYTLTGRARNSAGVSPTKQAKLVVVRRR